jgi:branched-chain amino acid transport system ATP-binding protein
MLEVRDLHGGYGGGDVLSGLSFEVGAGELVTLMGRNGMGKTTTVRAIMGQLRRRAGSIQFQGQELLGRAAHHVARAGIGLVPEGRQVFPNLTVRENLIATAAPDRGPWHLERVHALFPRLRERDRHMGRQLSGGEQQMLAIGRALMTNPRLLILDEATEGLAPMIRAEIHACLAGLKAQGQGILLIDKHVEALLDLADRHVIIEKGRCIWQGSSAGLRATPELRERHLGV